MENLDPYLRLGLKSQAALFNATCGWLVYMLTSMTCKSAQTVWVCGGTIPTNYTKYLCVVTFSFIIASLVATLNNCVL